jgi:carbohydrate-selective porin OprB
MEQSPFLEAQVYRDYGAFMHHLGRIEEARAYFGRAQELFVSLGASEDLRQLEADMMQVGV